MCLVFNSFISSGFICDALRELVSVTIWRLRGHSNAWKCMLTLFSPSCRFYPFAWVSATFCQMSNVWMPIKRVNTSSLMTFEWCFLISKYRENCNAMSCFTALRHVPWNTFICSAAQCLISLWFLFTTYYLFFSDAGDKDTVSLL